MTTRTLGRSGIVVSALGFGCWPIGGTVVDAGRSAAWGAVDDAESVRALRLALDLGVTFFDTAETYGRSEELLGRAFAGRRDEVVLATKFGREYDRVTSTITGRLALRPQEVRRSLEGSLRRLRTDVVDLYQLHVLDLPREQAVEVRGLLEDLVAEGSIRAYGWSTDVPGHAEVLAEGPGCTAIQHHLNVIEGDPRLALWTARHGLASIIRGPLAMGLLGGRYDRSSRLPATDVRGAGHPWLRTFVDGRPDADALRRVEALHDVLTSDGRSPAQGALAWLWAVSPSTIPIPGFKGVRQAEENARALQLGPLTAGQLQAIDDLRSAA